VLNINIKPSKNYGYFGQASVGGGQDMLPNTDEKWSLRSIRATSSGLMATGSWPF
jgi:hypothetical protein